MRKNNSPYSAAFTGCGMMYNEFMRILPLLMSENQEELLKDEVENNRLIQVNSKTSRDRFIVEFKRRYNQLSQVFWEKLNNLSIEGQKLALFYAILKTYKLIFDFQYNVALRQWNSVDSSVSKNDIMQEFCEISNRDEFVSSWTDKTKEKCASQYLTILRQAGLADKDGALRQPEAEAEDYRYYIENGEEWFLEACLLYPYQIDNIKSQLQ